MTTDHWLYLIHPTFAIIFALPLVGIVSHFAWQTRQRRLKTQAKEKTKISPTVGLDHVRLGKWLTSVVVGVALLGLAHPIFTFISAENIWSESPGRAVLVILMFGVVIGSLAMLFKAKKPMWRVTFSALSTIAFIILGSQDGIFRRENEWFISHFFYGMAAGILMIISVAILPEIYKSKKWRNAHIILNSIAFLLFVGLGITGARDIFEIALYQSPAS